MSEINLDNKIVVKNLCAWDLSFPRIESYGDVYLVQKGSTRLTLAEIQSQIHSNNVMFVGTDGKGSHARIFIDDKDARIYFGFEEDEKPQFVLNAEEVKNLLEVTGKAAFEKAVKQKVVTQSEKMLLVEESKRLKLNDFGKIQFIEKYTGYKFDKE